VTQASPTSNLSTARRALLERRLRGQTAGGPVIPPRPAGPAPLAPVQHGMWVTNQFLGTAALYNVPRVLHVAGPLDVTAFQRALDLLVVRHEILRTSYPAQGSPVQQIGEPYPVPLARADVGAVPGDRRWDEALRLVFAEIDTPFDLAIGPVFRALAIRLGDDPRAASGHILVINLHHIATDAWSSALLLRELDESYSELAAGREPSPARPAVQYADYAAWQQARMSDDLVATQLGHWRRVLASTPVVLELPTDTTRPATPSHRGDCVRRRLSPELSAGLRALAAGHDVTLYTVLLCCFAVVLRRYSGQSRFAVGSLLSGRNAADAEQLLGLFANAVALPVDLSGDPTFAQVLRQVNATVLDAFDNQDVTFEQVVSDLRADRTAARNPVYQVLYQCFEADERPAELASLGAVPVELTERTAKVDLTLNAVNGPEGVDLTLNYALDLFGAETAERLLGHLVNVAERAVAAPEQPVDPRAALGPAEDHLLTRVWAENPARYPNSGDYSLADTMVDLFRQQVARNPAAVAVQCGGQMLTYAALDQITDRVAAGLRSLGIVAGDVVGVSVDRSVDLVAAVLGVVKAGAAYLALDPAYPAARIAFLTGDAGVRMVLERDPATATTAAGDARRVRLADLTADTPTADAPPPPPAPTDLVYVMYTSGSTGQPKGIEITHRGLVNFLLGARDQLEAGPADRWLLLTSLNFDPSTVELFLPLIVGARVVVVPEAARRDGAEQRRLIRDHGVTHVQATPSGWELLLADDLAEPLQVAMNVGETMPAPMARRIRGIARRLVNAYGPTEITVFATYADIHPAGPTTIIGRPAANTRVYLVDEAFCPVPQGAVGEIVIGGTGVARSYRGRPGLTARSFVPDPFGPPGARLYRTGDRARFRSNGDLDLQGRIDHQVKIRGHRVEPEEVEARLLGHPQVARAAVTATPGPGGGLRLIAYVVPVGGGPAGRGDMEHQLRRYLSDSVPSYLLPSSVVALDQLPLTPSGKVDRRALADAGTARPADDPAETGARPRTGAERALAAVWASVLDRETVGLNDNFFEIGGDSVLAVYVVAEAARAGLTITPRQVLTEQTLGELAAVAAADGETADNPDPGDAASEEAAPDEVTDRYPLSPLQAGMLFHALFEPAGTAYVVQFVYALTGAVDPAILGAAWRVVVDRHPGLRTTFAWEDIPQPMQLVHRRAPATVRALDWRDTRLADLPARLDAHLADERRRGFDLERTPPRRLDLIQVADGTSRLLWHGHHIMIDGWSLQIVLDELLATYRGLVATGTPPQLPEPVPYRSYIDWVGDQDAQATAAYWRTLMAGVTGPTEIPVIGRAGERGEGGSSVAVLTRELSAQTSRRLRELARRHRLTVSSIAHAAWALVLSRYAGTPDVVFGSTVSGRSNGLPGVERMVGLLINTVPVRLQVPTGSTVEDWLRAVHSELMALRDVEHSALIDIKRQSPGDSGHQLFDTILMVDNVGVDQADNQTEPTVSAVRTVEDTGYPLVLNVGLRDVLRLRLDYRPDLVEAGDGQRLLAHYEMVVEEFAAHPDALLGQLPALPADEADGIVQAFNATGAAYPSEHCLHDLFEDQADRTPTAVAARAAEESVSYRELEERANRLAHHLIDLGVRPETLVGICVERGVETAVAVLAVLKAGGAYVPLDPDYPAERLAFMLVDTAAPVVLTQTRLLGRVAGHRGRVVCLDGAEDAADIARHPSQRPARTARPENLAYVIYTSGSTGRPKGTQIRHRGIVNYVWWMATTFPLNAGEGVLQLAGLSFDISVYEMFWPWSRGGTVLLARPDGYRNPQYILDVLAREKITAVHVVPSMLRALLSLPAERPLRLRWLFASAEALPMDVVARWRERCPDTVLINLYGATEASVDSTAWICDESATVVSVGSPIANTQVHVLDPAGRPVPTRVAGEAYLAGDSVGRGYHGRPGLTARRFRPDPFGRPGARRYATGDLVRWSPEGTLEFLGRLDHQVKIRGFRVETGEVEAALAAHPELAQAVTVAVEEEGGSKRLVAYVVPSGNRAPTTSELRVHLQGQLPEYMVPAAFVTLSSLPLNPNGKVDRQALPAPEGARPELDAAFVAPRDRVEATLAEIWRDVLGVTQVGVHDDFFELGGDSILAIQVVMAVRRAGHTVTPAQMFDTPRIAGLAAAIEGHSEPIRVEAEQGRVVGIVPLTPIQHWFTQLDWPYDHYNQAVRLCWDGPVEESALRQTLATLVDHHDALRLRLTHEPGRGWGQYVAAVEGAELLRVADLGELPPDEVPAAVDRAADHLHSSLSLSTGPLLRALLLRYENDRPDELIVTVHHVAVDAVSWDVLLDDLAVAYRGCSGGAAAALPAKTTSFQHWAVRQRDSARSADFQAEAAYWRMPAPATAPVPVPADHDAGPDTQSSAAEIVRTLDPVHTEGLLRTAHAAYRTRTRDLLVTALAQALVGGKGGTSVQIDLEGHGREPLFDEVDLSRTVGWFTTLVPLRLRLLRPEDPGHCIRTVQEHLLSTPHRGIGHGMVRYLRAEPVGDAPASVSFNYHGQLRSVPDAGLFVRLGSVPGRDRAPDGVRPYPIEVEAAVIDGVLSVRWTYSRNRHRDETVGALADRFVARLTALLAHCRSAVADSPLRPERAFLDRLSPGVPSIRLGLVRHRVPGAALALVADGEVLDEWGEGVTRAAGDVAVQPNTIFPVGSLSKMVAAMTVLRLVRDGALSLDEDVDRYLRSWRLPAIDRGRPVTLRALLSHTAGLTEDEFAGAGAYEPDEPLPDLLDVLSGRSPARTRPVRQDPAAVGAFRYSGNNYLVVEQILRDRTGVSFPQLARELVFGPLEMRDSGYGTGFVRSRADSVAWGHDSTGAPVPGGWRVYPAAAGGLWTTAGDLARLMAEVQRAHAGTGAAVLDRATAGELLTPSLQAAYGLGAVVRTEDGVSWWGHSGETRGFRAHSAAGLQTGAGVVVLTNGESGLDFLVDLLVELDIGLRVWLDRPAPPGPAARRAGQWRQLLRRDG
jgi:amino acid adenylation domain-containing protein/non-ribosomal peptide synthase protein (TIGR01720 family)